MVIAPPSASISPVELVHSDGPLGFRSITSLRNGATAPAASYSARNPFCQRKDLRQLYKLLFSKTIIACQTIRLLSVAGHDAYAAFWRQPGCMRPPIMRRPWATVPRMVSKQPVSASGLDNAKASRREGSRLRHREGSNAPDTGRGQPTARDC